MATTITFTAGAELLCVVGAWIDMPIAQVLPHLPSVEPKRRDHHITLAFQDPLDAILGAHQLGRAVGERCTIMSAYASALACEMLREPTPIAREAITWLIGRERVSRGFLFATTDHGRRELAAPDAIVDAQRHPTHGLTVAVYGPDDEPTRVVTLTQPGWLGRQRDATITIHSDVIARRHIELGVDSAEGWFVRDAGSSAGYTMGRAKAGAARHTLHPGMTLGLSAWHGLVVLDS